LFGFAPPSKLVTHAPFKKLCQIKGVYDDAEIKILLFGDSWAAFNINGTTWPDKFQRNLEERLGKSVHVVNFARDGYGILQMFDLAAHEIKRWKPDLIIFSFITDDLARLRTWRVPIKVNGRQERVVTHFEQSKKPNMEKAFDTFLIHADATQDWCEEAKARGTRDDVIDAIFEKRQSITDPSGNYWADIYTLSHSYLLNRLIYGGPFHGIKDRNDFPRMKIENYDQDARFIKALETLKAIGTPAVLFHNAFFPEVVAKKEFIVTYQQQSLLDSLIRKTSFPMVETLDNVDLPVKNPRRMNASKTNLHPSLWGMEFYSKALIRALIDKKLLFELIPKANVES
jgi:hypothetical protein